MTQLPPDVEQALAALAVKQDPILKMALDVLTPTMDALALDETPAETDPTRRAAVIDGLQAVLPAAAVQPLVDGATTPAAIAARFFRLKRLLQLSAVLGSRP